MSSTSSPVKWLLGCGVVFLLVICLCAGVGLFLAPKVRQMVDQAVETIEQEVEAFGERLEFAAAWKPPAEDATGEDLFPPSVLDFTLAADDQQASVDEFKIDLAGHRADYESGSAAVEVFVYRATSLEREAIINRVDEAMEDGGFRSRWHTKIDMDYYVRYDYSVSPPSQRGVFWWAQDCLFLFRSTDAQMDLDPFLQAYLEAIQPGDVEQVEGEAATEPVAIPEE